MTPSPFALMQRALALACGLAACVAVQAKPLPVQDRSAQITAREQPLAVFLQDLFSGTDIRVSVSPSVKHTVNGQFNGGVEKIYNDMLRSFNLVGYYDGSVLHVSAPQDMVTRTLPLDRARALRVRRTLEELDLADARNQARVSSDGALLVSGARRFVEQVEEIARATGGVEGAAGEVRVFRLRYAWAQDVTTTQGDRQVVLPGVASIVRAMMAGPARSQVVPVSYEQPVPTARSAASQGTLGAADASSRRPSAPVLQAAQGAAPAAGSSAPPAATATVAADLQQVRVEAMAGLNAVLVRDVPQRMPQYEALIAELDVEPQAVDIEASIIDVNTDKMRELGISWRYAQGRTALLFGRGDESDLRLTPATPVGQIMPSGPGGFVSSVLGNAGQFISLIRAMEEQGAARVVTRPQVSGLSNTEAAFSQTQEITVPVAGREAVDVFTKSVGTTLRVTPHVFKDGGEVRIKLLLSIEDGTLGQDNVAGIPVMARAAITTQAMIYEGESLLVGGMTRVSSGDTVSKVPVLGDVPVIGALFRNQRGNSQHVERMVLLTPRLLARRAPQGARVAGLQVQDRRGPRPSYAPGEGYEVKVVVPEQGFLYCYLLDEQRRLHQFFPNPGQRSAAVAAQSTLVFPGSFGFRLQASRNPARETVACVHTRKDLGFTPLSPTDANDADALARQFRQLTGDEPQIARFDVRSD